MLQQFYGPAKPKRFEMVLSVMKYTMLYSVHLVYNIFIQFVSQAQLHLQCDRHLSKELVVKLRTFSEL